MAGAPPRAQLGRVLKGERYPAGMSGKVLPISIDELQTALEQADPPTPDDVSITVDGRRLDSKDAVLAWCAEIEANIAAGRLGTPDDDGRE